MVDDWIIAGRQAAKLLDFAIKEVRPGMKLIEIAKLLYEKMDKDRLKPAFPINLSLNEIAAHYTPDISDETVFSEEDLLKIDIGIKYNSGVSDTAITLYFGNDATKKKLVMAAFEALEEVKKKINSFSYAYQIGETIENKIKEFGFSPIYNLGGHGIEENDLHVGFIPNYKSNSRVLLPEKFAIEPFATNGEGYVIDAGEAKIFSVKRESAVRDQMMRELLNKILQTYGHLPFSLFQLRKLTENPERAIKYFLSYNLLEEYPPLKDKANGLVSQFEHTFVRYNGKIIITTERENERFIY